MIKNAFYAQSGGVTAVINATASGVIETARAHSDKIGTVFAGKNGILGALNEELIDTSQFSAEEISALRHTPGGAFGSCRYKLKSLAESEAQYRRLIEVFSAHNIGYFFYNGGGDSQDTADKVSQLSASMGYPLTCIGVPKTVDNDLPLTDCCPGFGSVAKYVAITIQEASLDVASMAETSTKVFVLEVMGRHAGWIAAASALAQNTGAGGPHIILFPEIPLDEARFYERVQEAVNKHGFCSIVTSEGVRDAAGKFLSASTRKDAFGHAQLGGAAPRLAQMIQDKLGYKYHWAVADYCQRAARHIASAVDVEQAYAVGKAAVEYAIAGENAILPIIVRTSTTPYEWHIDKAPLSSVANQERMLPRDFITSDGFGVTEAALEYLGPLIQGGNPPPFVNGLPDYVVLKKECVPKKLSPWEEPA